MRSLLVLCFLFYLGTLKTQILFEDASAASNINVAGWNSGIGIADFDEDGDEDVYVTVSNGPNLLFRSNGDGTFDEIAADLGLDDSRRSYASLWGDMDNDGDLDLVVANRLEPMGLYINAGNGVFEDKAADSFLGSADRIRSLMLVDYDKDGWLDIYVANFNTENQLFRNNGNLTFTNVILGARAGDFKLSMGAIFFDYDNDEDQDLYLTRDSNQDFVFYENIGSGFFEDKSAASGLDYVGQGMGVDVADVNKDGWLDVYVTNLFDNVLYLNNGDGTFEDITATAKVNDYGMTWGTTFFDFDNDGLLDIYSVNDSRFSAHPNVLYRNTGDNVFEVVAEADTISSSWSGYGAAYLDANMDGKLDMFIANFVNGNRPNEGNQLFINRCENTGNWFRVKARAVGNNSYAVGSRINVFAGGEKFIDEVTIGSGYCSHHSYILHFGLGDIATVDSLSVHFPDGTIEWYYDLPINSTFLAQQTQNSTSSTTEFFQGWAMQLTPNPAIAETSLSFHLDRTESLSFSILNVQGQVLWKQGAQTFSSGSHQISFDITDFPKGLYLLEIRTPKGLKAERFTKF